MIYCCPKCKEELVDSDNGYKCINNHQYDRAKEGYVNLVLVNQKNSKLPGDSKESLISRKNFLDKGYYKPLSDKLNEIVGNLVNEASTILDAGCGTGYYLGNLMNKVKCNFYAVDIGKEAVRITSKANKQAKCAVCSVFHLPVHDKSVDVSLSVFCPYSAEEFARVTKDKGYVISVTPGKKHLYEMKEIVYESPYENEEQGYTLPEFELIDSTKVVSTITINNEDIESLWRMTPYFHKTSVEATQRLFNCDTITTTIDFLVNIYKKK